MNTFGKLLREYRQRCNDPEIPGRRLSQGRLGELLAHQLGILKAYSAAAVSDWERGVSKIHVDDRVVLMDLIRVLQQCGGIEDIDEANSLLLAGNYKPLEQEELIKIFPNLKNNDWLDKTVTQEDFEEKDKAPSINWPPYCGLNPVGQTKKESALWLVRQTPSLVGCLSCFQLYPFVVVEVDIFIDQLLSFLESWLVELM